MKVGERIKYVREERGLSQEDLANMLGLKGKSSVCKIEKAGDDISIKSVERYALALGVSPSYLMGWKGEYDYTINLDGEIGHVFIEFCDQYRLKDGLDFSDLFLRYVEELYPDLYETIDKKWNPPLV